ncbi:MAG: ion transporter [Mariniblastus sp.]|nr:ion transporter [Mariniblastus sp.]
MTSDNPNPDNHVKRDLRDRIHEVIFGAHTPSGLTFDILLLVAIVLSVVAVSLETVGAISERWHDQLVLVKWFFTVLFTIEYGLRLYCVRRPLNYALSFWGVIDLLAILPDYFLLLLGFSKLPVNMNANTFSVIRSLRLLRVFRILNLSWFQNEAEDLKNAVWRARGKIIVFLMVVMIIVTVSGTIMFEIEKAFAPLVRNTEGEFQIDPTTKRLASESQFDSIPDGIYWAIVTMTTVGFGDIVPVTFGGKIISAVLILVGYSLIIVPTGFVSAEVIESKRLKTAKTVSTKSCPFCICEGHDDDAAFCKYCGEHL